MIRLPEISEEKATQFYKDTRRQMHELLISNRANPQFRKIICYCSENGKLNDEKIKKLLIGDFTSQDWSHSIQIYFTVRQRQRILYSSTI